MRHGMNCLNTLNSGMRRTGVMRQGAMSIFLVEKTKKRRNGASSKPHQAKVRTNSRLTTAHP